MCVCHVGKKHVQKIDIGEKEGERYSKHRAPFSNVIRQIDPALSLDVIRWKGLFLDVVRWIDRSHINYLGRPCSFLRCQREGVGAVKALPPFLMSFSDVLKWISSILFLDFIW